MGQAKQRGTFQQRQAAAVERDAQAAAKWEAERLAGRAEWERLRQEARTLRDAPARSGVVVPGRRPVRIGVGAALAAATLTNLATRNEE